MTLPTGILFNEPRAKPLNTTGGIQPGCYYQFYLTGTTTQANVYTDGLLSSVASQTPGTGQTTAAGDGRLVPIYLNPATVYRVQLYSSVGTLLEDTDPYVVSPTPGQLLGTSNADNANTGNVGEYIQSVVNSGSAVALATGTVANVTSISLSAGDWDVSGIVAFLPAGTTTITQLSSSIGTTSATIGSPELGNSQFIYASFAPGANSITQTMPIHRISVASTTVVYLCAKATFATSTMTAYGGIYARRTR